MHKVHILIVEDEALTACVIEKTIIKMGYRVTDCVTNYTQALKSIENNKPDIILLDIHLKNSKDGIQIATSMQKKHNIPIIYLTADHDDEMIRRASTTNPYAYLNKPFKKEDLKSTLLLTVCKLKNTILTYHSLEKLAYDYSYDKKSKNIFCNNHPIHLSPLEKSLLEILIDAQGEIVPFYTLEYHIWSDKPVSEGSLRTLLSRLRQKLKSELIETIPTFGCKIKLHIPS